MKRHGNLWDKIVSIENLELAHYTASKGKSKYKEVIEVNNDVRLHIARLRRLLNSGKFTTSPYKVAQIFDGNKHRIIHKLPYWPDRVVQHAIMAIVEPILRNSLIRDTFQSIKKRGAGDAFFRLRNIIAYNKRARYAVKLDIKKFYPSINNDILKAQVRTKIKCRKTLDILDDIIDSTEGLPIGNYTSQILGNFHLSHIDWTVKQELKPIGYFRYCDDMIVIDETKERLNFTVQLILSMVNSLGLKCKDPIYSDIQKQGIDFVGYLLRPAYSHVRSKILTNFKDRLGTSSVQSYKGWFLRTQSLKFFNKQTKAQNEI